MTPTAPPPASAPAGQYTFDNSSPDARDQVRLLAQILDQHTFTVLDELSLPLGARCADLGAGAGTVAVYLAELAGPGGHVLVVDKQPQHVPEHPQISIRRQDVTTARFEPGSLDVIHARLLFMHLRQRVDLVAELVPALKPGGAMVISDWATDHLDDMWISGPDPVRDSFGRFQHTMIGVAEDNGMDSSWARRVPAVMRDAGLTGIRGHAYNRLWRGGQPGMLLHASNSRQLEVQLLAAGMTSQQLHILRTAMDDPQVMAWSWDMRTTIGFRPTSS